MDPRTRATVPRAASVLREARRLLGDRAQCEFYATQVEGCTPPVRTAGELRDELVAVRTVLASAAAREDCLLIASGSPVLPSAHPLPINDGPRYRRMAARVGPAITDRIGGELCGCHVHVGDVSRPEALDVSRRLRPWLPVVQALSVNSPFCEGLDSGAASARASRYACWPTVGPAPCLDEAGYERHVGELVRTGAVLDRRSIYWYARPSEHLPTLEVRVADVNADVDVTVLLAILVRGLVRALLDEEQPGPRVQEPRLREAHRRAAHGGVRGDGLDVASGSAVPMRVLVAEVLDRAAPGLAAHGDLGPARQLASRILADGTGADTQRAVFARRNSLSDVADALAATTADCSARPLRGGADALLMTPARQECSASRRAPSRPARPRAISARRSPRAANATAHARPMPALAPVTTTVRHAGSVGSVLLRLSPMRRGKRASCRAAPDGGT